MSVNTPTLNGSWYLRANINLPSRTSKSQILQDVFVNLVTCLKNTGSNYVSSLAGTGHVWAMVAEGSGSTTSTTTGLYNSTSSLPPTGSGISGGAYGWSVLSSSAGNEIGLGTKVSGSYVSGLTFFDYTTHRLLNFSSTYFTTASTNFKLPQENITHNTSTPLTVTTIRVSGNVGYEPYLAAPAANVPRPAYVKDFLIDLSLPTNSTNNYLHVITSNRGEFVAFTTTAESSQRSVRWGMMYLRENPNALSMLNFVRTDSYWKSDLSWIPTTTDGYDCFMFQASALTTQESTFSLGKKLYSLAVHGQASVTDQVNASMIRYSQNQTVVSGTFDNTSDANSLRICALGCCIPQPGYFTQETSNPIQPVMADPVDGATGSPYCFPMGGFAWGQLNRGTAIDTILVGSTGLISDLLITPAKLISGQTVRIGNQWYVVLGDILVPIDSEKTIIC